MENKRFGYVLSIVTTLVTAALVVLNFVRTGTWSPEGCMICALNSIVCSIYVCGASKKSSKNT